MVPRMVCSSLRVRWVLFWGMGGANRVLILSLIFSALQHHLWGAGQAGLGGGHLDNGCLPIALTWFLTSNRHNQGSYADLPMPNQSREASVQTLRVFLNLKSRERVGTPSPDSKRSNEPCPADGDAFSVRPAPFGWVLLPWHSSSSPRVISPASTVPSITP